MLPLTNNLANLIGLTSTAVVLSLVAVFAMQFLTRLARNVLEN
jgi:hypothetical protein